MRKRLVPFLITSATPQHSDSKFLPLSPAVLRSPLSLSSTSSVVKAGHRLYRLADMSATEHTVRADRQAIGEVVRCSSNHGAGLAMLHLDQLFAANSCRFAAAERDGHLPASEEQGTPAQSAVASKPREVLGYVSPFQPSWFPGLDHSANPPDRL